jgi:hypothetical protein
MKSAFKDGRENGLVVLNRFSSLLLLCLMLLVACRPAVEAPEEALRRAIAEAVTAAEKKDLGALTGLLATDYRDNQGRDRQAVAGMLRYYFLGHQAIYLLTRIRSVEVAGEQAQAEVLVAMAGEPLADPNEPTFVRASLYRFELAWVREQDAWKIHQARWQAAELRDFLLSTN